MSSFFFLDLFVSCLDSSPTSVFVLWVYLLLTLPQTRELFGILSMSYLFDMFPITLSYLPLYFRVWKKGYIVRSFQKAIITHSPDSSFKWIPQNKLWMFNSSWTVKVYCSTLVQSSVISVNGSYFSNIIIINPTFYREKNHN